MIGDRKITETKTQDYFSKINQKKLHFRNSKYLPSAVFVSVNKKQEKLK